MTIIEKSRDFTLMELYKLTQDPQNTVFKEHVGEVLEVTGYVLYTDDDDKEILTLELAEGSAIGGNSPTIQRSFMKILALYYSLGQSPFPMTITIYTAPSSKNKDRNFIDIRLIEAE